MHEHRGHENPFDREKNTQELKTQCQSLKNLHQIHRELGCQENIPGEMNLQCRNKQVQEFKYGRFIGERMVK